MISCSMVNAASRSPCLISPMVLTPRIIVDPRNSYLIRLMLENWFKNMINDHM